MKTFIETKDIKDARFNSVDTPYSQGWNDGINSILENAPVVKFSQWIPIRTRKLTDEEIEEFLETREPEELPEFMFDCELPEDGEEILICFSGGMISQDIYEYDPDYGAGLEGNGDFDGVIAWMPLPEPYIPEENTDE